MKRKQRPNVSLLLWLTKEFIILSILSNLVCTALYMAGSWLLTGTPLPASQSSGLGPLLFLICSNVILGCGLRGGGQLLPAAGPPPGRPAGRRL